MPKRHIVFNVQGALNLLKGKRYDSFSPFDGENGRPLTVAQARESLQSYLDQGYKYVPNDECPGFDPYGGGCPSHEIDVIEPDN